MERLTTDNPQNIYEITKNMVYGVDGWQYIRYGQNGMPTTDFCLMLCKYNGCQLSETITKGSQETKDEWLYHCMFDGCPIAAVYAALSGFGHVRDRLKMYEDAGDELKKEDESDVRPD